MNRFFVCILFGFLQVSYATVNLQNGNFNTAFIDISVPGLERLTVERTYNTKAIFTGMFGKSWGSSIETCAHVLNDGTIQIIEYGGGAENLFVPDSVNASTLKDHIQAICDAELKQGIFPVKDKEKCIVELADLEKRTAAEKRLEALHHPVPAIHVQPGVLYRSNKFAKQVLRVNPDKSFVRSSEIGDTDYFNAAGKLVKTRDSNGNEVLVSYDKSGHTSKVTYDGRTLEFTYNAKGFVETIVLLGIKGQKAEYKYNGSDQMIESIDAGGKAYRYKYNDKSFIREITEVNAAGKELNKTEIEYYGQALYESVKKVSTNELVTNYSYIIVPGDDNRITTKTEVIDREDKNPANAIRTSYAYIFKRNAFGDQVLVSLKVTVNDTDVTETTYNEATGLPREINHNKQITSFTYDEAGHLLTKTSPEKKTVLTVDRKSGKTSSVRAYSMSKGKESGDPYISVDFTYDAKGNLILAQDNLKDIQVVSKIDGKLSSKKHIVALTYNSEGEISTMADAMHQVFFSYAEGKPIKIAVSKRKSSGEGNYAPVGAIDVTYQEDGQIKKTENHTGPGIADDVASIFQELYRLINLASERFTP